MQFDELYQQLCKIEPTPRPFILDPKDIKNFNIQALNTLKNTENLEEILSQTDEKEGNSLLHLLVRKNYNNAAKFLISKNIDINKPNKLRWTALHLAAFHNNLEITQLLLKKDAVSIQTKSNNNTPLFTAAHNRHINIVKALLEKYPADIDIPNKNGYTPLHIATSNADFEIIKLLIENNANINAQIKSAYTALHAQIKSGYTALHLAARNGKQEIIEFLIENNADTDVLNDKNQTFMDILENNLTAEKFLEIKQRVNKLLSIQQFNKLFSQLTNALNDDTAIELLENTRNLNELVKQKNHLFSNTLLHIAVQKGFLKTAKLLIESGANVNAQNNNNDIPLHSAAQNDNLEVLKYLLEYNANVDKQNKQGDTPLHLAAHWKRVKNIETLINNEASISRKNSKGRTFLDCAEQAGNKRIRQFLCQYVKDNPMNKINKDIERLLQQYDDDKSKETEKNLPQQCDDDKSKEAEKNLPQQCNDDKSKRIKEKLSNIKRSTYVFSISSLFSGVAGLSMMITYFTPKFNNVMKQFLGTEKHLGKFILAFECVIAPIFIFSVHKAYKQSKKVAKLQTEIKTLTLIPSKFK